MITVDLDKAKTIAHDKRRIARDEQFKPLDLQATIPMYAESAEEQRQGIRDKFEEIQTEMENASTVDELKTALERCSEC